MAEIINRSQQVRTGAVYPISAYSRVISCSITDDAVVGDDYAVTEVVGQRLWLLNVKVFWNALGTVINQITDFRIMTGKTDVTHVSHILGWENILKNYRPIQIEVPWQLYDGEGCLSWDMSILYTGTTRRFGIWANRRQDPGLRLTAAFQISEG